MSVALRHVALSGMVTAFSLGLIWPVSATVTLFPRDERTSAHDWDPVLQGASNAQCADLAVIFARGTFDIDNLGVWVGGPFGAALLDKSYGIKTAIQGVDASDYPADLAGYIEEGGSNSCAKSVGDSVQKYVSHCPHSKVAIWGWSQGALCAHKSLGNLGKAADNVIALGVFGDPIGVWQDSVQYPQIPKGVTLLSYCEKTTPDPLCTNPTVDFPKDPLGFVNRLKAVWKEVDSAHMNEAQKKALKDMAVELPKQAMKQLGKLGKDLVEGHIRRWMLTPEHFWYGIDGKVETAAEDLVRVYEESKK